MNTIDTRTDDAHAAAVRAALQLTFYRQEHPEILALAALFDEVRTFLRRAPRLDPEDVLDAAAAIRTDALQSEAHVAVAHKAAALEDAARAAASNSAVAYAPTPGLTIPRDFVQLLGEFDRVVAETRARVRAISADNAAHARAIEYVLCGMAHVVAELGEADPDITAMRLTGRLCVAQNEIARLRQSARRSSLGSLSRLVGAPVAQTE